MIPATPTMSVLGTMMLRAGLLSESQAAAADEHAATQASSHVDAILELGLADEDTLVAFLASKLMIPRVRSALLDRVDTAVIDRLASSVAREFCCVPVSADELGNLTVAMADPTDARAVTAIATQTGAYLVRAIATASELRRALERHYGPEQRAREQAAAAVVPATHVDLAEADRTTEIGLEPVRYTSAPAGVRNPAPQNPTLSPGSVGGSTHMAGVSDIGRIPTDDDDDVPIRNHAAARELPVEPRPTIVDLDRAAIIEQRPTVQEQRPSTGPITDIQTGPPPDDPQQRSTFVDNAPPRPLDAQPRPLDARPRPISDPYSDPNSDPYSDSNTDPHTRPTFVEQSQVAHLAGRGPRRPRAHTPWNPPLQGVAAPEPTPLSPDAFTHFLPLLEAASERDAVTAVLLDFLAAGFNRVILFVHSHNELRGLDARGKDLMVEAVRQVRIPSTGKSMFSSVLERGIPSFGPTQSDSKIDQAFSQALGGIKGNVLLLPITLGSKVPLLVWAHGTTYPVDPRSITELSVAVSDAIQRILAAARKR